MPDTRNALKARYPQPAFSGLHIYQAPISIGELVRWLAAEAATTSTGSVSAIDEGISTFELVRLVCFNSNRRKPST